MIALSTGFTPNNIVQHVPSEMPELRSIGIGDLAGLQKRLLDVSPREDSYSQSAAYYAMTGRKGLWLYSTDDTFMVMAAHPNRADHLLLFPPMGKEPAALLEQAIHDERITARQIQFARFGASEQLLLTWAQAAGHVRSAPEEHLDWVYPVHTLSTHFVAAHQGKRFRDFRKGILRAERDGLSARLIETAQDRATVGVLVNQWARRSSHEGYSTSDLTAPTRTILAQMETSRRPLHGLIIERNSNPAGFITWEETDPANNVANSMCNVTTIGHGASEFSYKAMAEVLAARGFDKVCIGGSESAGLDQFKRKMNPVVSTPLKSAYICRY